jgi:hypothetical protein
MVADAKDVTLHSPESHPAPAPATASALSQPPSRSANASNGSTNSDRSLRHPSEPSIRIAALIQLHFALEAPSTLPSCSRLGRPPVPAPAPLRVTVYTVREVLLSAGKQHGWRNGSVVPCVLGVLIYKGLLVDDLDPQPPNTVRGPNQPESYKTFCDRQAADYRQSNQPCKPAPKKCRVVLRDEEYDDIITLYMPVSAATTCVVGLCVAIWGSTIHLASSLRTLYLKSSEQTQIGTS